MDMDLQYGLFWEINALRAGIMDGWLAVRK
jgi:hypothetical protein